MSIIFVNCKTGMRARLASSILAQNGIPSIIVTDSNNIIKFRILRL